jgi:hypothetical protein
MNAIHVALLDEGCRMAGKNRNLTLHLRRDGSRGWNISRIFGAHSFSRARGGWCESGARISVSAHRSACEDFAPLNQRRYMNKCVMSLLAAVSFACSATDDGSETATAESDPSDSAPSHIDPLETDPLETDPSNNVPSDHASADSSSSTHDERGVPALGQVQQAFIDLDSPTGCFGAVPPFIFPQDVLVLGLGFGGSLQPTTFCGGTGAVAHMFMIQNFTRTFGRPFARPVSASIQECADLELVYAVGRRIDGAAPEIVLQGSAQGQVRVDSQGRAFCDLEESLVASESAMPDGEDYFFAVQVLRDGGDGITEPVQIVNF